jgi:predicted porin
MKKTILAMAVPALLAAGAANATVSLYDADGTSVEIKGAVEVQYRQTAAQDATDQDGRIRVDDGDLALRVTHSEDGVNYAFGALELKIGEDADNASSDGSGTGDVTNDGLYVGLGGNWGELSFGRQLAIIDDAGVGVDYELKDQGGVNFEDADFDQLIKYRYSGDGFWAGASYNLSQDDSAGLSSQELVEIAGGVNIIDSLELRAYYASFKDEQSASNSKDQDGWDVELAYNEGPFYVGVLYGNFDNDPNLGDLTQPSEERDVAEFAASYSFDKSKVGVGYAYFDTDGRQEGSSLYINYGYNLLTNCRVYAEVGFEDVKGSAAADDWDGTGFAAGMEVKF